MYERRKAKWVRAICKQEMMKGEGARLYTPTRRSVKVAKSRQGQWDDRMGHVPTRVDANDSERIARSEHVFGCPQSTPCMTISVQSSSSRKELDPPLIATSESGMIPGQAFPLVGGQAMLCISIYWLFLVAL